MKTAIFAENYRAECGPYDSDWRPVDGFQYHNYFRVGVFDARDMVSRSLTDAQRAEGWCGVCDLYADLKPEHWRRLVRVGQVKVHNGDLDFALYVGVLK